MQLKIRRSQRTGGVVTDKVFFALDARVELSAQEQADVKKYKLGKMVIYNSEASKKHIEAGVVAGAGGDAAGLAKAAFRFAMARLNLNISIDDLCYGKHVECKDLDELLGAEEAVMTACENLRRYLDTAATFDGREVLVAFNPGQEAALVAAPGPIVASPPSLSAPPSNGSVATAPTPAIAPSLLVPAGSPMEAYESFQTGSFELGETLARFQAWWRELIPIQRIGIIGGGVVALLFLFAR